MASRDQAAASTLYESAVRYLLANGWRREHEGSGWWWKDESASDDHFEAALWAQLEADGIDSRSMIDGEPREFWGDSEVAGYGR